MDYNKYYKKVKIELDQDQNIDKNESGTIDKTIYILLLTALLIIPLFIKAHIGEFYSPKLTLYGTGIQSDIFSFYKYIFLIIITSLIAILFLYKVIFLDSKIVSHKINLLIGVFAILIILSGIFSPYKTLALQGMFNRYEGAITYICYLALFFVAANMKFSVKQIQRFLYSLYPFVIINMLLGYSMFQGKNPLEIGWVNKFILGSLPEGAQLSEGAKLLGTVSNPNYISGIGGVLTVLFLTWAIFDKNKVRSSINVIISIFSFIMVLTSYSTSGFLTMMVLLLIILTLVFFNVQKVKSFVVLLAFVILATSVYVPIANKNPRVWEETFGFVIKENPFVKDQVSLIDVNRFVSKKGLNDIFLPARAYAEGSGEDTIRFQIPTLPASGISGGTGRTYIWDKTIETAMKRPILGYGLDTYIFVFPQNDIDKVAGLRTYNIIVDKPHNLYLGLLIGSGIIALMAFILLMGSVLFKGVKAIWKRKTQQSENAIMLTLFTASIAYLVQGMFNDSVIGAAVIFWVLLGVLVSIFNKEKVAGG